MKHGVPGTAGHIDQLILRKTIKKTLLPVTHMVKAIELLRKKDIALIGYAYCGNVNIYSHERRIQIEDKRNLS